ncbi:uncharacterized protein LOC119170722 isoform X1 [Rhipicephalus microplus]|nr:uncharacterized protein LOC119170722 [Rhipicephalus microplus]
MPSTTKTYNQCISKRGHAIKLSAYATCLGSSLLVASLGFCLRHRLEVLAILWNQTMDQGHQRYLLGLAVIAVVLGFSCALVAVVGVTISLLDRSTHMALDVIFAVLILAEVGIAAASFMLMTWIHTDVAPEKDDCEESLRNVVIVTDKLLPAIGSLFLLSSVTQAMIVLINRLEQQQDQLSNSLEGSINLQKDEMIPMENVTGFSSVDESNSLSTYLDCSTTSLDQSPSKAKRVFTISSATQQKSHIGAAASSLATAHSTSQIPTTGRPRDAFNEASVTATIQQEFSGPGPGSVHPEFSGCYDNEQYAPSHHNDSFVGECFIPSAPPAQ